MKAVSVAKGQMCGADKPLMQLRVTSPAGEKTYTDSFYACRGGGRTYIDNIDEVFGALADAARKD